jgi:bacteriocin biosynthesis cyclodehydratase domain-containing protein
VEPLVGGDGSLYLVRAGADDLVVRDAHPADRRLVELLAHGHPSVAELARQLDLEVDAVRSKLEALADAGVLVPAPGSAALDPEDAQRFSRQLPYLAELGDERDLQRRLGTSRVAVIGCGGLGTWAIAALAAAGVRRLRLIDDDVVELSNLNRQVLYALADVGTPKVDATAAWLRAFDDRIDVEPLARRVDGPAAASEVVAGADALVLAADAPPYVLGRWVNEACLEERVPFITGGQLPPLVRVGPLYMPGRGACFGCHELALRRASAAYDEYADHLQSSSHRGATLGTASGIVGSMLAMDVVHVLLGERPATAGAALLLDLRTLQMRREPVARDPGCAACKHLR